METLTLILFCIILLLSILLDIPLILALLAGLLLFIIYCLYQKYTFKQIIKMCLSGINKAKNILFTFILIGMLSSMLRATGTISYIVTICSSMILPSIFILITFLLNCFISFLTGTSFGTSATMGIICFSIGASLNINPCFIGGAVLSGIYFGDRCSPVSTSALLVSSLTNTSIHDNVKRMLKSCTIPFIITCIIYLLLGLSIHESHVSLEVLSLFDLEFNLNILCLLPALSIILLSLFKVNVKMSMTITIVISIVLCIFVQHMSIQDIFYYLISGYHTRFVESTLLEGGGILSMINVGCIVCISSCFAGIFENTSLLDKLKHSIHILSSKTNHNFALVCTSIISVMIACNQTLAIMMTYQLCHELKEDISIDLEDSVVVIAGLVPWCIACAVPLATIQAPTVSIFYACFLYLLPLYSIIKKK